MARVIAGIGTSHSPCLNMTPAAWRVRAEVLDKVRVSLYDTEGRRLSYAELEAAAPARIRDELKDDVMQRRFEANQRAIATVAGILDDCEPDVLVIFGDDHHEVFKDDNMPPLSIYCGESIPLIPHGILTWSYPPELKTDLWYPEERRDYPVDASLARYLIEYLNDHDFDVAYSKYYPEGQGMSHAFAFAYWRLMQERVIPTVPINLNTYFPPNQVTPERSYEVGRAVRRAIESWDRDARVAIMATGGLSHFVIDEALDQMFIDALRSRDRARLTGIPRARLNGGNSELRNWIALAGSVEHLDAVRLIDYVPCYRSIAGTGCAMSFAHWH
jgi:hypothetical protein